MPISKFSRTYDSNKEKFLADVPELVQQLVLEIDRFRWDGTIEVYLRQDGLWIVSYQPSWEDSLQIYIRNDKFEVFSHYQLFKANSFEELKAQMEKLFQSRSQGVIAAALGMNPPEGFEWQLIAKES